MAGKPHTMPGIAEITNAIAGSIMLARRDLAGYRYFEVSPGGFWRSFLAYFLIVPFYLAIANAERGLAADLGAAGTREIDNIMPIRCLVLAAEWIIFPFAMIWVCRMLDLGHGYVRFIVAYNWSSVPAVAFLTLPFLLYQFGIIGSGGTVLAYFVMTGAVICYRWFIARTALDTTPVNATGVVAFDFMFGLVIGTGVIRLFSQSGLPSSG